MNEVISKKMSNEFKDLEKTTKLYSKKRSFLFLSSFHSFFLYSKCIILYYRVWKKTVDFWKEENLWQILTK